MAHLIDMSNHRANIAYVGEKPWHNLGQELKDDATLDEWRIAAGLNWDVIKRPVFYGIMDENGKKKAQEIENQCALIRSDTQAFLGQVSKNKYHEVQPSEVVAFFHDLVNTFGFKMETMGSLQGGARIWALAKTPLDLNLGKDKIEGYQLLSTSYDGKSATLYPLTSTRVVCANTLGVAEATMNKQFRCAHNKKFDEAQAKTQLGIYLDQWNEFSEGADLLASTSINKDSNHEFFTQLFGEEKVEKAVTGNRGNVIRKIANLTRTGKGANLPSAKNTLWGLVNAVTEYYDHHAKAQSNDTRMNSAFFGEAAKTKRKAFEIALELAA